MLFEEKLERVKTGVGGRGWGQEGEGREMLCGKYQNEKKMKQDSRFWQSRPQILLEGVITQLYKCLFKYINLFVDSSPHVSIPPDIWRVVLRCVRQERISIYKRVCPSVHPSEIPSDSP